MKSLAHLLIVVAALAGARADAQTTSASPGGSVGPLISVASQRAIAESNAAVFKACQAAPQAKGACPLKAIFGLFKLAPDNAVLDFKPSNTVPLVVNQNYGWIMRLNKVAGKVRVLERVVLPEPPKTWGAGGQPYGTSADRKTISLDVELDIHNGVVSKSWDVALGDPPGHYVISAFVEDSAPVRFEFDVVDRTQPR